MTTEFSVQDYVTGLSKIDMTLNQVKMLQCHYYQKNEIISATQLALKMEWENYSSANLQYGGLAGKFAEALKFNDFDSVKIRIFVDIIHLNNEVFWKMKLNLITAIIQLGFVTEKESISIYDEEPVADEHFSEGALKQYVVNRYERNSKARQQCIKKHGAVCSICGFSFQKKYGDLAKNYIEVHHIKPLSEIGEEYHVDTINDLIPVCSNCHSVIHLTKPPLSIADAKAIFKLSQPNTDTLFSDISLILHAFHDTDQLIESDHFDEIFYSSDYTKQRLGRALVNQIENNVETTSSRFAIWAASLRHDLKSIIDKTSDAEIKTDIIKIHNQISAFIEAQALIDPTNDHYKLYKRKDILAVIGIKEDETD